MVTRIWHGRTHASKAEAYLKFLNESGIKDYLKTPGNIDVKIWRKIDGDIAHFWTVTTWKDLECIKAFAGEDIRVAKYYPGDDDFLLGFEPYVEHYECWTVAN